MPKHLINHSGFTTEGLQVQNLSISTIVRLRWIAILGQFGAVMFVSLILKFDLPLGYCLAAIAVSAWLNVYLAIAYPSNLQMGNRFATVMLLYDILQLMFLLYLTGGIQNPFTMLIVAPVTVSASTLPLRNTISLGLLSIAATAILIFHHWPLPWYDGIRLPMPFLFKIGMFCAVSSSMIFITLYAWRLADESRRTFAAKVAAELVLAREQKLHALDGLAAAAAHELGTPLSTIYLVTKELSLDQTLSGEHQEDITLLREQAQRCQEILRKLTYKPSEQDDPMHSRISVRALLDEAVTPHRSGDIAISFDAGATDFVDGVVRPEPTGVRQPGMIYGLGNLIENVVSFAKSKVVIKARWDEERITVEISDDGPGFSQEIMDTLGNPYVTTRSSEEERNKSDQGGLGLGFFIAKTLLERYGANFEFDNKTGPETGAIVRITWSIDEFTNPTG